MKLLMISGDRSVLQGRMGAFWYTLQEMRKHFDRIDIICPKVTEGGAGMSESGHKIPESDEGGAEVFFHPCPSSLIFQIPWITNKGQALIAEHGHDVMTVHDYPPFYNGIGAKRLHKRTGIPYATEIHHIVGWPKAANIQEVIGREMSRWYLRSVTKAARAVRTVNDTVARQVVRFGVAQEKVHVISSFYLDKEILSHDYKPPVSYDISFCGRLVANKGLSELISALVELPTVRLLVIGDGPERSKMERKVKDLGISNRVTFLGWLPTQEAVSGAMQTARIFVMNSKSEGGPRIALEAMACGLPIIATQVGVMPEAITDGVNGIFTTGTTPDLVEKISTLLANDDLMESMGNEAKKVLELYERSTLIKQYADFLKSLA
jgi:glycosyltransferase involved in cell wall biosynthesis